MKILVPTDLSDNAKNALSFAKAYAHLQDASVTLLYSYYAVYDFASQATEIIQAIEKDARVALKKEIQENSNDVLIDYKIVQGTVSTAIQSLVYKEDYDLIIMGTQGASGIKKKLMGSNTATVVKESEVPVIAVPSVSRFENVKEIAVAVELIKEDEALFTKLINLTETWDLPYSVIHVEKKEDFNENISFKGLESYLKETYPDNEFKFTKIRAKGFEEGLEGYMNEHPDSMLVMFSKNKTFFEFIFNKSHSMEMAYHSHVPLLVIK